VTGKVVDLLRNNETVMKDVTESVVEMPTALGLLGRFRLETTGENGGKFNVRLLGWDPLIMNVRVLSLRQGINETNTVKRIKALREMNVIAREVEEELTEAYLVFMRLRITAQIECDGREDLSYVDPQTLDAEDAFSLRKAMGLVEGLQKYVNELRPLRQAV
jgi:CBS domain-containing protein